METNEPQKGITQVDINQEMKEAYLQYSMSVIVGRALPDVRDGLKPVHRRVLFAMHELNNTHDKPYKKSARIVGDVIGKYHPHGDVAAYDTMVRMAQEFSLRYPLIDGQGNFGSIDGDSPAAQRYTEVRMTHLAEELLADIEKETVPFVPNYDDSLLVPAILPAKFPNLLVNGSSGIAVGMATNIPPHNLGEVIEGCVTLIDNPQATDDEIISLIPGPDFPTHGVIAGRNGIISAYKKGHGIITIKAVAEIVPNKDREEIIVTEIPYQVNKARLIESIADLVRDKKIEGISDIRDESSREGMRIVITLKRNENASVILNRLFKYTQMQVSFGIRMLALDAQNRPRVFSLKEALQAFIDHRKDVVIKRCVFDLKKSEARAHILQGLKKAIDHIDEVVATIKNSKETSVAKLALMQKFEFSDKQAQAILDMRLARLTGLESQKIADELAEIMKLIAWLKDVLGDETKIFGIIKDELVEIKRKFNNPRRTQIVEGDQEIEDEDLIAQEKVVVSITKAGYIKRIPVDQYKTQRRGGKGVKGADTQEEDFVTNLFVANTKTTLLVFTSNGKIYWTKVYRLPQGTRTSKGKSINNVVEIGPQEQVRAILPVEAFEDDKYVIMLTKKGTIKKTPLSAFSNPRPSGIIALTIDIEDDLLAARLSDGKQDVFICTQEGMSIRFDEEDVRPMGRTARGVRGISLSKEDHVVGMEVVSKEGIANILIATAGGYGKRAEMSEYRRQNRGGVGIITQKTSDKIGQVVTCRRVNDTDDIVVSTDQGQTIRMACKDISVLGRNTQGVRLISLKETEFVTSVAVVQSEDDETAEGVADDSGAQ
ncbi:MAG: DNA gyrase subunit A [Bdellovibrionaceae bacterium]|nr:DNA gyrase subunit A [Pseudobdellovibrionaceae bacterium]